MIWVAIEAADTREITDFERVAEDKVLDLMDGYRVDKHDPARFRLQDVEDGKRVVYEGVIYRGGFGYNLLAASKYLEL